MNAALQIPEPPRFGIKAHIFEMLLRSERPVSFRELYAHDPLQSLEIFRALCYMEDCGWIKQAWNGTKHFYELTEYGRSLVALSLLVRDGGGFAPEEDHGDVSTHLQVSGSSSQRLERCAARGRRADAEVGGSTPPSLITDSCGIAEGRETERASTRLQMPAPEDADTRRANTWSSGYQAPPAGINGASATMGKTANAGAPETMVERVERVTRQNRNKREFDALFEGFIAQHDKLKGRTV